MKDLTGLIKYLLVVSVVIPFPILFYLVFILGFGIGEIFPQINKINSIYILNNPIVGIIFLVSWFVLWMLIIIYYFKIPILYTKKAMKDHWSKYLDFFFNSFFLMTLLLVFIIGTALYPIVLFDEIGEIEVGVIWGVCLFIAPVYFLIYITAVIYKIKN